MTDHVIAAERSFLRRAREDPEGVGQDVEFYADGVAHERWTQGYQDAVGQPYRDRWLTLPQVLQWVSVNDYVGRGQVGVLRIELGHAPQPDRERRLNAEVLDLLPEPFTAELDQTQHASDDDGVFKWSGEVRCLTGGDEDAAREVAVACHVPVPLEVGACLPSRVHLHLRMSGAVARWPYHSTGLWLLVGLPTPFAFVTRHMEQRAQEIRLATDRPFDDRVQGTGGGSAP